jgi:hypothetical protein
MTEILNYGGGTQTVAMCVLVTQGILPVPDAIIAADTGREMPSTWDYANKYMIPFLQNYGISLHIASHNLATVDLYDKHGSTLMPVYTKTGKTRTFCSTEWKARVVRRFARRILNLPTPIINWIGFSADEVKRVKGNDGRKYPLLDLGLTRNDCVQIINSAGLPIPPKSRCWMCPNQTNSQWKEVFENKLLWDMVTDLDEELRDGFEMHKIFLHKSRTPLRDVNFDNSDVTEPSVFCESGNCFV